MRRSHLCIRCWRAVPVEEARYLCPECGRPGERPRWMGGGSAGELRPVRELLGPRWRRWLRRFLDEPPRPACPWHPEAPLRLHCSCGAQLDPRTDLGRDSDLGLGFAGPQAAGKTLHVITAIAALQGAVVGDRRVSLLGLDDTEERFERLAGGLLRRHAKPDPTPPSAHEAAAASTLNFCWELVVGDDGRDPEGLLAIHDTAGETWALRPDARSECFGRYLGRLSSVVFTVDGASVAADLGLRPDDAWDQNARPGDRGAADRQWLTRLIDHLGPRSRHVDVAVTLSKSDLLWDRPEWRALAPPERGGPAADAPERRRAVEEALDASGRGGLLGSFRTHFREVAPFAVSSLGFRPAPGDVDAEGRLTRSPEPVGVIHPLVWLLGWRVRGLGR